VKRREILVAGKESALARRIRVAAAAIVALLFVGSIRRVGVENRDGADRPSEAQRRRREEEQADSSATSTRSFGSIFRRRAIRGAVPEAGTVADPSGSERGDEATANQAVASRIIGRFATARPREGAVERWSGKEWHVR
jgi:hypothetical protein